MVNALVAGLSGLRVHQQLLDVVGNNLANANTPGFKGSRATFAQILTNVLRQGTSPTSNIGGTNPIQTGLGVRLGTVDVNQRQGSFTTTGRTFDLAVQGNGFFVVTDGTQNFFTRSGTFGLDSNNDLVDLKNGFKVKSNTEATININTTGLFPPQETTEIFFEGNLPAKVTGPLQEILTSSAPLEEGTAAVITGSGTETFDFSTAASMSIAVNGGQSITINFNPTDFSTAAAATAAEVAGVINNTTGISSVLIASASGGQVVLTTVQTGTDATIQVTDGTNGAASTLGLSTTLTTGAQSAATAATLLNDLEDNTVNYTNGDIIQVIGVDYNNAPISAGFTFGATNDGTDLGDLLTFLNSSSLFDSTDATAGATASIDSSGNLVLTANNTGETGLSLVLSDGGSNTGITAWGTHSLQTTQAGTGRDTVVTSIPVFDAEGVSHTLTFTFLRDGTNLNSWDLVASIPTSEGTMTDPNVDSITFDDSGVLLGVLDQNAPTVEITYSSGQTTTTQVITLTFERQESGETIAITQFGDQETAQAASQDGFAPGTLTTLSVRGDGVVQGIYSNGQLLELASLGIATFANPEGLQQDADTLFLQSVNSGTPTIGAGQSGSAGTVVSGVLENSNVEVAEEFVRLVEAQRGFQSSARVIRAADEILRDLNNLV